MWQPWGRVRSPAPCLLPHHVPQQLVTAASHGYNVGQYLQHNESMYTWTIPLACFRERHTHTLTHMYTHVRARDLSTRAQWRKLKWHFLAFAAWLVLEGVVGGEEKQQPGGKRGERESLGWMWGRYNTLEGQEMVLKVGKIVEAGKPGKRLNTGFQREFHW